MEGSGPAIPAPLNEAPEEYICCYDRVLLRAGLEIQRAGGATRMWRKQATISKPCALDSLLETVRRVAAS